MSARVEITGLDDLERLLREAPRSMTREAANIIEGIVNGAAVDIQRKYPRSAKHQYKGDKKVRHLQDEMKVITIDDDFSAGAILRNNAPHARIFEFGSSARHTINGAFRGSMPAAHTFFGVVNPAKRRMNLLLTAMVERHGFEVTGEF